MIDRPTVLEHEEEEINLTPLLDCIFILVFFFLVATTIRDEQGELEVQIPQANIEATAPMDEALRIVVAGDGTARIGNEGPVIRQPGLDPQNLDEAIGEVISAQPSLPVEIISDAETPVQALIDIMASFSNLGVSLANVRTQPSGGAN